MISQYVPSAHSGSWNGSCCDGITVTSNGILTVPPTNSNDTNKLPVASDPLNVSCVNLTLTPVSVV